MPFKTGGKTWWCSVPSGTGGQFRVSTGTRSMTLARAIEGAIKGLGHREANERVILKALEHREITAAQVFEAVMGRKLPELYAAIRDFDLEPYVAMWHKSLNQKSKDEYLRDVRMLIPAGQPFKRSQFTTARIQQHLDQWSTSTRNRYRTAFSRFAVWLKVRGLIDTNPVRDTLRVRESDPRVVWYTEQQAKAVIGALPYPFRALEALMCGTSMELGAALAVRKADIHEARRTIHAHGTKNKWRDRECVMTEDWCWLDFWAYAMTFATAELEAAPLFTCTGKTARRYHHLAVAAAGATPSTLHDWRHTFAVRLRKRGISDWRIAELMGHRDTSEIAKVYGRFIPDQDEMDYRTLGVGQPIAKEVAS